MGEPEPLEAIQIRPATLEDFEAICGFVRKLSAPAASDDVLRAIFEENASKPKNVYLMAFARNIPVGFVSCHVQDLLHHGGPVGEIQEMFVTENVRSHGIGKMLLDRVKEIARENDVLQLEVSSNAARGQAHLFYEREGFEATHKKFVWK